MKSGDNHLISGGDKRADLGKVRMVPDLPTSNDAFGAHQRLADALAGLIANEEGGKAVALEGGWGSGKSSVVEMLKAQLEQEDHAVESIHVHVFDAWSHEGDPLRRVFLEDLTDFCSERFDEQAKEHWKKRKKTEITGRTRETDQTTTPVLRSRWPLLVLAGATLYPISIVALGALLKESSKPWWLWILIAVLALIAIAPAIWLCLVFFQCKGDHPDKLEKAGQWISLWGKKIGETTNTTAHETAGPTSIEFQKYFSELVAEYLQDGTHKLVLVLDNLDRVPARTARALWATLRVFAECCEHACNSEWSKRTWFIVPYDPSAAQRLWDDDQGEDIYSRLAAVRVRMR